MNTDVIVLGAGMVGVSAALHLQKKGRSVVLIDRRGAGEETSYGNAGLIQLEGVVPYPFPRDPAKLFKYAFNLLPDANLHWSSLPKIAPWLLRYFLASNQAGMEKTARAAKPLVERCVIEHQELMREAGIEGGLRRTGYLKLYRDRAMLDKAIAEETADREKWGVNFKVIDAKGIAELEPHVTGEFVGAMLMPDPASVPDPEAVAKAYATLLTDRGGKFLRGEARTLERVQNGWQVLTGDGPVVARDVVVALGPWSDELLKKFGFWIPLGVKRGYHMHYRAKGNATLNRAVLDTDNGYVLAPMKKGIRLTTGAEFARRDAPKTPVQLEKVEPFARKLFPLEDRVDAEPWLGARPCLPDMLPAIGPIPGNPCLWADFGHHHLGFTLGPVSGRLIAEIVTGATPFTDPTPYRPERFA